MHMYTNFINESHVMTLIQNKPICSGKLLFIAVSFRLILFLSKNKTSCEKIILVRIMPLKNSKGEIKSIFCKLIYSTWNPTNPKVNLQPNLSRIKYYCSLITKCGTLEVRKIRFSPNVFLCCSPLSVYDQMTVGHNLNFLNSVDLT